MEVGIALVAGVVIGWLIEWIIDWQYWRRGVAGFYAEETQLRSELAETENELRDANTVLEQSKNELSAARAQLQASKAGEPEYQRRLEAASTTITDLEKQLAIYRVESKTEEDRAEDRDNLEHIDGISQVYAQQLADADILTFAQLASVSPDELNDIVQPAAWQQVNFDDWIAQATEMSASVPSAALDARET